MSRWRVSSPEPTRRAVDISDERAASSSFRSIDRTNRSQQVRDQLEASILRGEFKAGEQLPSERTLGATFGVSRVSVREALRSLEALGLVEVRHGRGSFVVDGVTNSSALFRRWLGTHSDELLDLLNVHKALDGLAAAEAAAHRTPATVETLERICAEFDSLVAAEDDPSRLERISELDIRFHETIAYASSSPLIEQLVRELNRYLVDSRVAFAMRSRPAASAREHRAILHAIATGDAAAAQAAMTEHV